MYVVGLFRLPSTIAVAVVTAWSVGVSVDVSAGAAVGDAGVLAGCVAAVGVASSSSATVGTRGPVVVGSDTVSVGCTGGAAGGGVSVGGGKVAVAVGGTTAVEVAGWARVNGLALLVWTTVVDENNFTQHSKVGRKMSELNTTHAASRLSTN